MPEPIAESLPPAKRTLRTVLRDSHVAVAIIAFLLLGSVESAYRGLWDPLYLCGRFLFEAAKLFSVPYLPPFRNAALHLASTAPFYLADALIELGLAWAISKWVHGTGLIRTFQQLRNQLVSRTADG
jgi:hypothetical protein